MLIKKNIIDYKKFHPESRLILNTILGEFDRISKNPSDEECIKIIKKCIEGNEECGNSKENELLNIFIPQQLSLKFINELIWNMNFKTIGECMKFFKDKYSGLYDGKIVSSEFNKLICQK